jgi:hypothetical protein
MGMQDRDWYHEKRAKQNEPWHFGPEPRPWSRASNPIWKGAAIAAALALTYWLGMRDGASTSKSTTPQVRPLAKASPEQAPRQPQPRPSEAPFQIRGQAQQIPVARDVTEALPEVAPATRTVYLCKGYSGGLFWSSAVCSSQRATIDRMFTVTGNLAWADQVAEAERQWGDVRQLYAAQQGSPTAGGIAPSAAGSPACAELDDRIRRIDAAARQPQSAWAQDQLRQERMAVRSRQAELRC